MSLPELETWDSFLSSWRWKQGEHVTLLGPTGCGKTTLTRAILSKRAYVIVFATKQKDPTIDLLRRDGFEIARSFDEIHPELKPRAILWPRSSGDPREDAIAQARVFRDALARCYRLGGWTIVADEARYLADYLRLAPEMEVLWQQGRSLGVTLVAGTQRPRFIPLAAYDQASWLFCWRDNDKNNLDRLAEMGGALDPKMVAAAIRSLPKHEVLCIGTRDGTMRRTKAPA